MRRLPDGIARWLPAIVLVVVALNQLRLAHTHQLSPWSGGGFGMFSLAHAIRGGRVMVVEVSQKASDAGRRFMGENRLAVTYVEQDLAYRPFRYQDMSQFDAMIVDPPRSGLHGRVLRQINTVGPRRLIYVSCHPAALARDLALLTSYTRVSLNPVDLFPQTPEVEVVAVLERVR